jgi:hypothetical protein
MWIRGMLLMALLLALRGDANAQAPPAQQQALAPASAAATQFSPLSPPDAAVDATTPQPAAPTPGSGQQPLSPSTNTSMPAPTPTGSDPVPTGPDSFMLPPFRAVRSCLPVTLLLSASPAGSGMHNLAAPGLPQELARALQLHVDSNASMLTLGFNASFEAATAVVLNVTLPMDALLTVHAAGTGNIIINRGALLRTMHLLSMLHIALSAPPPPPPLTTATTSSLIRAT